MRRILWLLIVLIFIVVATIAEFMLCAIMLLLVLDTHSKFVLLCTVLCFAVSIWTCKNVAYVYRYTFTKIKEYFSFRFQKGKDGFEKEEYCKSKRITSDKHKKENKYMKLEATFVIENSVRKDQIDFAVKGCGDRYSEESTLAEKIRKDIEAVFSDLSGREDFNGVPTKVIIKDVRVYFDDGTICSEDNRSAPVPRGEE